VAIVRPLEPCSFVPLPFGGKSVDFFQELFHPLFIWSGNSIQESVPDGTQW
jgi:hypothetical protein